MKPIWKFPISIKYPYTFYTKDSTLEKKDGQLFDCKVREGKDTHLNTQNTALNVAIF